MSVPYQPSQIHRSHELESIGAVGHCKLCLEAWVGEFMTPGLLSACTMVKPQIDPMTGHPVEFMEREGFGQQVVEALETIHKAALDTSRANITEPRSPMLDVSDWDVEVQVVKD